MIYPLLIVLTVNVWKKLHRQTQPTMLKIKVSSIYPEESICRLNHLVVSCQLERLV